MKRAELAHVLRAASDITRAVEFLVVGSAAILGSYDDGRLPDDVPLVPWPGRPRRSIRLRF